MHEPLPPTAPETTHSQKTGKSTRIRAHHGPEVEQAKAIVSMLLDVDDDDALGVLRNESEVTGTPIDTLSVDLIVRARQTARDYGLAPDMLPHLLRS